MASKSSNWTPVVMDDDEMDQREYSQLIHMNRSVLVQMLVTLNEPYEYDADKQTLAYLILARRKRQVGNFREKIPSSSRDLQDYCQFIFFSSLISLFILLVIYAGLSLVPSLPRFCDTTNATEPCTPCPTLAICARGIALCAENHTFIRGLCVLRDGDEILVAEGLEFLIDRLRIQAGKYRCHLVDTGSMSNNMVEEELTKHWNQKNRYLIPKVISRLSIEPNVQVLVIDGQEFFVTQDFRRPFSCEVKLIIAKSLPFLPVVVFVATFIGVRNRT
jgi:hypothetical protein